ncbi:hypothetical protein SAMN05443667_11124 [Flavobacterium gillisiae]|uniref:Uncharacterized protein n=1 Tax=Flavobacterium gillisiae TaxID=150146 RepID=A0A1H4EW25_9FLAO|nr:hypothetical protein [Flavobacterium gillisiae]SEA89176.1 hypothetical protein SAMN05443667_11124 [Flavobacterium gillisiae]
MNKFLAYILFLLTAVYIIGYSFQLVADFGLKKIKFSNYEDWSRLLQGTINADIVIVGSSRGFVGYDPKIIGNSTNLKTHNLSYDAAGFKLQQSKLKIYLKHNHTPKIFVQNIDLAHFNDNDVLPNQSQFIPFINDNDVSDLLSHYDLKYQYLEFVPLLKYNNNFKVFKNGIVSSFTNKSATEEVCDGFSPKSNTFKNDQYNIVKLKRYLKSIDNNEKIYKSKLNKILAFYEPLLADNSILIFVWAPEYKARLDPLFNPLYSPIKEQLNELHKHNSSIYFIDLSHNEISQNKEFFYDTFHLNQNGAHVFSLKLSNEIKKILKSRKYKI